MTEERKKLKIGDKVRHIHGRIGTLIMRDKVKGWGIVRWELERQRPVGVCMLKYLERCK